MKKFFVLLIYFGLYWVLAEADQNSSRVRGTILEKDTYKALVGVNVVFYNLKDTTLSFTYTDNNGWFIIPRMPYGEFRMEITHIGYQKVTENITVAEKRVEVGRIFLKPEVVPLQSVEVTGVLALAVQIGDTTQYNADAFTTTLDATAEELILKMPGIVDNDGTIQTLGENVVQVLVDGKPFFGDDPTTALKNLPAEIIDKIQIYDQQSDQSLLTGIDDGNTKKTINIVIKPGMKVGQFGKIYAGYAPESLYQAGANLHLFNGERRTSIIIQSNNINSQNFGINDMLGAMKGGPGGGGERGSGDPGGGDGGMVGGMGDSKVGLTETHAFGLNFQDKLFSKIEVAGSYFFNYTNNDNNSRYYRQYTYDPDADHDYYYTDQSRIKNINHRFNLRMDYDITKRDKILFTPSLAVQLNNRHSLSNSENYTDDLLFNTLENRYRSNQTGINLTNNIMYRHEFIKNSRILMISLNNSYNGQDGDNRLESLTETESDSEVVNQQSQIDGFGRNIGTNISFVEDLGRFGRATVYYNVNRNTNSSNKKTYDFSYVTGEFSEIDTASSSVFDNNTHSQEIGFGHSLNYNQFLLNSRLNYQTLTMTNDQSYPEILKGKKVFRSILPSLMLKYKFSPTSNVIFRYTGTANTPELKQLQEVLDNHIPEMLSIGNAALVQQFNHSLSIRFGTSNISKATFFYTTFSGTYAENFIGERTIIATTEALNWNDIKIGEGCQLTVPENFSGYYTIRAASSYGFPIKLIKSNLNLNLTGNYSHVPGYLNYSKYNANNTDAGAQIGISSNISRNFDFNISTGLSLNSTRSSLNSSENTQYLSQRSSFRLDWTIWKGFNIQIDLNYQYYERGSTNMDNTAFLWNVAFGKKFFKNDRGDLHVYFYDILNQNNNITRRVTDTYIEESQSEILGRYFMLKFTYSIRNFPALNNARKS